MEKLYSVSWRRNTLPEGNWNNAIHVEKVIPIIMEHMNSHDDTLNILINLEGEGKNTGIDIIDDVKKFSEKYVKKIVLNRHFTM